MAFSKTTNSREKKLTLSNINQCEFSFVSEVWGWYRKEWVRAGPVEVYKSHLNTITTQHNTAIAYTHTLTHTQTRNQS